MRTPKGFTKTTITERDNSLAIVGVGCAFVGFKLLDMLSSRGAFFPGVLLWLIFISASVAFGWLYLSGKQRVVYIETN